MTNHVQMLCEIGELNSLFKDAANINSFLQQIVSMVRRHMLADICSIYLYQESTDELILSATEGLNAKLIGNLSFHPGEGLVGLALKEMRPICEKCAKKNPHFKHIANSFEEKYQAFLAVPILRGSKKIGVLVTQRGKNKYFSEQDIMALKATASQLVTMLENAKVLLNLKKLQKNYFTGEELSPVDKFKDIKFIPGKVGAQGFAYGKITTITKDSYLNQWQTINSRQFDQQYTLNDFKSALKNTETQLNELQHIVEEKLSDAASLIFTAHLLMIKDKAFSGKIEELIKNGENPPQAILQIGQKYCDLFSSNSNRLIQEKAQDILDLMSRLLNNLTIETNDLSIYKDHIIISNNILPSTLLMLCAEGARGFILISGGMTSHIAILARSLRVPLIIVNEPDLIHLPAETLVLLDAQVGNIYLNPDKTIINKFNERNLAQKKITKNLKIMQQPTKTLDQVSFQLMVNINLLSDLTLITNENIDGIGLYRTEFPFIIRNTFPSEEEQLIIYQKLIQGMPNKPITFRTLDIGGDKILSYYSDIKEQNPFLGMRSIRFSLTHLDIFKQQIKAILRAGVKVPIKLMFPMISSLDEFLEAKNIVSICITDLENENIPHNQNPEIGVMIEIPATVAVAHALAVEADFFSIGTNDLIQYTLAVDRTNERVADFYIPHHPAILQSLKKITAAAHAQNKQVSICGDMAHEPIYIPYLLGIGIDILSVDPSYLPKVKEIILKTNYQKACAKAKHLLSLNKIADIEAYLLK